MPKNIQKDSFSWNYSIPVFSAYIIKGMLVGLAIFFVVFGLIGLTAYLNGGNWSTLTPDIYFGLGFVGLIFVITYLSLFFLFPQGFGYRCTINSSGVSQIASVRVKQVNRLTTLAGAVGRSPGAVGAGLTATSGEDRFLAWSEIKIIKINQAKNYFYFSKGRLGLFPIGVFCHSKDFQTIKTLINKYSPRALAK
ncbi:MAG TPA: hypothetical protein PK370_02135 [Candidatus Woesebacteria bacterium]|nr:hypothetical protein [Candidatus Woesebacteria bacterium]